MLRELGNVDNIVTMFSMKWNVNTNELETQTLSYRVDDTSQLLKHDIASQKRNLSIFQNTNSKQ